MLSLHPHARRLLAEIQSPRLKIILDPANLFETAPLNEQNRLIAEAMANCWRTGIVMSRAKTAPEQETLSPPAREALTSPTFSPA